MVNGYKRLLRESSTCPGKEVFMNVLRLTANILSMISYPNYKFYWPIRALGLYVRKYGNEKLL